MIALKVLSFLLICLAVGAAKKIELQDIEEDNLKSEKEKDADRFDNEPQTGSSGQGFVPIGFFKSGLMRYFEKPTEAPQQQRYVHQYSVTEPPERTPVAPSQPEYTAPSAQQAMIGYLSNVPMQIYLVPQYYTDQSEQADHPGPSYQTVNAAKVNGYHSTAEDVQSQTNYIKVPAYTAPNSKPYVPRYTQAVTYVYPTQPPVPTSQTPSAPVVAYQSPVVQYHSPTATRPTAPKVYYQSEQQYETNSVDEFQQQEEQKHYTAPTETSYRKPVAPEFPRYYNSRAPIRDNYRQSTIKELPRPNPLLLKSAPPHLSHIPRALPMYRPPTKPVYPSGGGIISGAFSHRPHELYGPPPPFKRRPTSLLDSYIPSRLQVEYLKRGLVTEPLAAYDAIASRGFHQPIPRRFEQGFLPNQMYHTGSGGFTFGHHKRSPNLDKVPRK